MDTQEQLKVYGFTISVSPAGRRIWPPRFKRYVTEKMDAGELSVQEVIRTCHVSKSLVYQWRMQARGKPVTASDWRAQAAFAQIISEPPGELERERPQSHHEILLRGARAVISLPRDYPVGDLMLIVRALEATA